MGLFPGSTRKHHEECHLATNKQKAYFSERSAKLFISCVGMIFNDTRQKLKFAAAAFPY